MAHLTRQHVENLHKEYGELFVVDDIIRHRAADNSPAPILAYPRTPDSVDAYETFTGQQLDRLIDGAVKYFLDHGLKAVWPPIRVSKGKLTNIVARTLHMKSWQF